MTILEAKYQYGTKVISVSKGTTLLSLARQLYDSDDFKYQSILVNLNWILDWDDMSCQEVEYFPKNICDLIEELW